MAQSASVNQAYFNRIASEYESRFKQGFQVLEQKLKENLDFIGFKEGGRLLDYACGTGLMSRSLAGHLSQAIGIDVSENMIGAYNAKAQSDGIPEEKQKAYLGNLILPSDPNPAAFADPSFSGFDLVAVGAAFHHFEDPNLAAGRLVERLRPGGVFFILDFKPEGKEISAAQGVHHQGFTEDTVKALFEDAGAGTDFAFRELGEYEFGMDPGHAHGDRHSQDEGHSHGHSQGHGHGGGGVMKKDIFIARGTKA